MHAAGSGGGQKLANETALGGWVALLLALMLRKAAHLPISKFSFFLFFLRNSRQHFRGDDVKAKGFLTLGTDSCFRSVVVGAETTTRAGGRKGMERERGGEIFSSPGDDDLENCQGLEGEAMLVSGGPQNCTDSGAKKKGRR